MVIIDKCDLVKNPHTSNKVDVREEYVTVELVNADLHVPCLQAIPQSRKVQVCSQLKTKNIS